jgi:hypothetical protein
MDFTRSLETAAQRLSVHDNSIVKDNIDMLPKAPIFV